MTDAQKQNIEEMRRQGVGYKRIAGSLSLSENTVKSFCQRNKLKPRVTSVEVAVAKPVSICKHCGKLLEPSLRSKVFCDDKCRYTYWNTNGKQRHSAQRIVCACCGRVFASTEKKRKYCGHPCYISSRFKMGGVAND